MDFRSKKIPTSLDAASSLANSMIMEATSKRLVVLSCQTPSATGDGAAAMTTVDLMLIPKSVGAKWRVCGVGGLVYAKGASTVAEEITWGHSPSDLGAQDIDAFGSFVQDITADKELEIGDQIYQGISPYDDYFNLDAVENAGTHVWDISGAGAGVLMGDFQTESTQLAMIKGNVANSTARLYGFFLVEIETGDGIT